MKGKYDSSFTPYLPDAALVEGARVFGEEEMRSGSIGFKKQL
jgi:hypothetical protein